MVEKREIIKFYKEIYKKIVVKKAIKAFGQLADFSLVEKGKYIKVVIKNINKDVSKNIKDEFCNYVLFLMEK